MKHSLTSGSIWRGMLFFALPILLGNIFQQLYNTADAFIVGRFLDKNAYAAVSSSGSLIFLLVGFFNGIAVGAGVVIARYYGAKDTEKLQTAVHTTLAFGLTAGIVLTVLGMTLTPQLLRLMKTDADVLPNSIDYFRMYFAGSIAIVMYNLCVGILQAVGDSRHPLYYLILSSLVNIALDLLFVGVFHWGVWSAALATSISQFVSLGLCIFRLCHYDTVYRVCLRKIRFHLPMLKQVIHFGLPSGVQNSIIAFANVIVQSNINAFGSNAMAGCGTYAKLEGFAFLPITCFTMALTTFVSQNLGAHQYDRVKKGVRFGIVCSTTLAECIGVVLFLLAELGKGALPVFLAARHLDPEEKLFALVMAAPVVGHAYPLIDRYGKGGKAIAVSFGVLLGLYPVFLPVLLLAGVYLFFSLVLVVEPHSLRTGLTFLIWSVLGVHFTPLSSIKYGIVLIAFVVIRKHLPEIRRIPKGQACFALRKG